VDPILLMARPSSRQIWRRFHAMLCLTTLSIFSFGNINFSFAMKAKILRMSSAHTVKRIVVVGGGAAGYFGAVEVCLRSRN
jgi:hypothetical protein